MGDVIRCATCQADIDLTGRCTSGYGMFRCVEKQGHYGWHWADAGHADGSVLIWTGLYSTRSCPARLSLSRWCQLPAGHVGPHNDGHGASWMPEEAES